MSLVSVPPFVTTHWVKIRPVSLDRIFTSRMIHALVASDSLCFPLILGGPFLHHNRAIVDVFKHSCMIPTFAYDLLNLHVKSCTPAMPFDKDIRVLHANVLTELEARLLSQRALIARTSSPLLTTTAAAVTSRINDLTRAEYLTSLDRKLHSKYSDHFPSALPPAHQLPTDVLYRIRLRDPQKPLPPRSYPCPRKY
ncbi:hypothetical protein EW146_g9631 [Bondarzewia mesenterica]|uniref:Uncharacterized protein n=1 Tax=Bondarzewia mesenterica TaxID=1095465 RepID=A0A4S4L6H1_9AGAM|nr:hypothetical protein EW146_g9631 [Bondarzewia mesenterica]